MDTVEIINAYIKNCAISCDRGGYTGLDRDKDKIRRLLLDKLNGQSFSSQRLVQLCERELFNYFHRRICQGERIFEWNHLYTEELRKELMKTCRERDANTALQEA